WNVNDEASGYAGFVTSFDIPSEYFNQFKVQNVGTHHHEELWVEAAELENFNLQIRDKIKVIKAFYGKKYDGERRY
ncbi:MAG: ADP-ribosylation/crystallin J1, partial [Bacteroidota bacterium]